MGQKSILAGTVAWLVFLSWASACKSQKTTSPRRYQANKEVQKKMEPKVVIDSPVAGSWYTSDPERLEAELEGYMRNADVSTVSRLHERLLALISPHAGYRFSGQVAAYGYKLLRQHKVKRIIILGPSHYAAFNGFGLPDATHWRTPLGEVPIDVAAVEQLKQAPGFSINSAIKREHSIDMQIPFIQLVAPNARIVPILVGQITLDQARQAAEALKPLMDLDTVVVASSDFTHYGPNYGYLPFTDKAPENLERLATEAYKAISELDVAAFAKHVQSTRDTICGRMPIMVLLSALPNNAVAHALKFDTSGRMLDDYKNSVSYFSIAFTEGSQKPRFQPVSIADKETKNWLLKLARTTLREHLRGRALPSPSPDEVPEVARKDYGVFVTLKKHGNLRGCIGSITPVEPLYKGVITNAVNAASHDPRFRPMTLAEEPEVEIEISILTPPKKVSGPHEIALGRDGVIITRDGRRAVYLPQVAPEQGWDLATTLAHLSLKAGLSSDAWKRPGTEFTVFQADVFDEREFPDLPEPAAH